MKYSVGDLVLVKECIYKPRPFLHHRHRHRPRPRPELFNSYGIVTEATKHIDAWSGQSTSDDNVYVWYSQIDSREYNFCENEVTGEVVE